MNNAKFAVLGAGTWGSALGVLLTENGHAVALWDQDQALLKSLETERKHPYLPGITIPEKVKIVFTLQEAVSSSKYLVTVIPAQCYLDFWTQLKPLITKALKVINCSKGIDVTTGEFIFQLIQKNIPDFPKENYITLSGPSHAEEVSCKIPTAVVAACCQPESAQEIQKLFCNTWFRVYTNTDVLGVELAVAIKNVIAIASGIADGIGYGVNTRAALITRGNAEIMRLGLAMGARMETFQGLAGIGDLVVTATSVLSRNYSFGKLIGQGLKMPEAMEKIGRVIEGIETVKATLKLSRKYKTELPISSKVYEVLFENLSPKQAVIDLMTRDLKAE